MMQFSYYLVATLGGTFTVIAVMLRANRSLRTKAKQEAKAELWNDIRRSFIADVANNHLPHIQHCLERIAEKLQIRLPDPPPIRYMPFDPSYMPFDPTLPVDHGRSRE